MKHTIIFWCVFITAIVFLVFRFDYVKQKEKVGIKSSTLDLIYKMEGSKNQAYLDSAGHWTIGVGHKIKASEPHLLFASLSTREIEDLLRRDLEPCERFLTTGVSYPINQAQFDALMSLCHNIGMDNLARSLVVFHLNNFQEKSAANAFLNWNKPQELTKRRREERRLFLSDI
jgi:GH24 family phage-related lysozyme (muramidase)